MPHLLKNSALLFVFFPALLNAQSYHGRMRQGDRLYDEKSWNAAETAYRKAGTGATAWYNVGNAAYQQGKYEAAAESFKKATVATTKEASSDAFYNLGNALMQQGKYKEAIAAYENSLRRQPNRFDAKKNLQIAKKKLKEQQAPPLHRRRQLLHRRHRPSHGAGISTRRWSRQKQKRPSIISALMQRGKY